MVWETASGFSLSPYSAVVRGERGAKKGLPVATKLLPAFRVGRFVAVQTELPKYNPPYFRYPYVFVPPPVSVQPARSMTLGAVYTVWFGPQKVFVPFPPV